MCTALIREAGGGNTKVGSLVNGVTGSEKSLPSRIINASKGFCTQLTVEFHQNAATGTNADNGER